ncbi:hypothetical protein BD410DRAFT_901047 [Rickenella mellea]|uniref:F-box domain-containing protein n=1 Tax=Rickenella mellea TaxID=50990 RepID=A0A4Y7PRY6_9AGAM|nr:hypothetical protein BD410DRAFT_901047 [Rickenella mellea]
MVQPSENASTTIQKLAPEVLTEIFLRCVAISSDEYSNLCQLRDPSQAPLLLGRVCSRWRMVSVSSPDLWSNLTIEDHFSSQENIKKDLVAANLWISRSGSRPLSIRINFGWTFGTEEFPQLLQLVASQSWRWKHIDVLIPLEFHHMIFAPFQTGCLPRLENFSCATLNDPKPEHVCSLTVSSAPQLQVLRLVGGLGPHIDFSGNINHLRTIRITIERDPGMPGILSLRDFLTCLTHCPLLEDLAFPIAEISTAHLQDIPSVITLSHLLSLSLVFPSGNDVGYLFEKLFLPALIRLHLSMEHHDDHYVDWRYLTSMLAHSRPHLQDLRLDFPMAEATLIESLSYIPSLTSLSLDSVECTDAVLASLTIDNSNPSKGLCPNLETIDFGSTYSTLNFPRHAMIPMILSRRRSLASTGLTNRNALENVRCGALTFGSILFDPDIVKCVDEGLKIEYGHDEDEDSNSNSDENDLSDDYDEDDSSDD